MKRRKSEVAGLVLAAGYSSRMGDFKPLLPFGDCTVIERAVGCFLKAGIEDVRVVAGWRANELAPLLDRLGVKTVINPNYDLGMYSSVIAGVTSFGPETEAFLLLPGDNPLVKPRTVEELVECYLGSEAEIVYPCFRQRRGHPPLVATKYVRNALEPAKPGGLRAVLREHEDAAMDLEVADRGVTMDLDTKADYLAALAYASRQDILDRAVLDLPGRG